VIKAYFAAANHYYCTRAWKLGGESTGSSDKVYIDKFNGTAGNTAAIISVSDDEVSARLAASPNGGTVKDYSGADAVVGGAIVQYLYRKRTDVLRR
jgi:hypothetical protein